MDAPALRILRLNPFALEGANFQAGEHVRIVVSSDGNEHLAKVRASASGSFAVSFESVRTGRSVAELAVSASGTRGSSVAFVLNQPLGRSADV
jgi:hypothetical protein